MENIAFLAAQHFCKIHNIKMKEPLKRKDFRVAWKHVQLISGPIPFDEEKGGGLNSQPIHADSMFAFNVRGLWAISNIKRPTKHIPYQLYQEPEKILPSSRRTGKMVLSTGQ